MADLGFANINSTGHDAAPVTMNPATGSFGTQKNAPVIIPNAVSTGSPATAAIPGNASGGYSTATPSPTVLSSANVSDTVIPSITSDLNSYTPTTTVNQNGQSTTTQNGSGTSTSGSNGNSGDADTSDYSAILKEYGLSGTTAADVESAVQNDPEYTSLQTLQKQAVANNDQTLNSTIDSITSKYATLNTNLVASQQSQTKGMENLYLLGGAVHTPSATTAISAKNAYDISTLSTLQDQENQALAAARQAHDANDLQLAQNLLENVDKIRTQKQAVADKVNEDLTTQLQTQNKAKLQAARDNAVAGEVAKGITDPAKILSDLNQTSSQYGDPFTSDEIASTLKNISPNNDYSTLSGNVKDFYELQEMGKLPSGVTDLKSYLSYVAPAKATTTGKAATKITLATAKAQKLPLSTVGMTEQDLADSFNSETPPQWFQEKLEQEIGASTTSDNLQSQWDTYKSAYQSTRDTSSSSGGP